MNLKDFINTNRFYLREVRKGKEKIGVVNIKLLQGDDYHIPCYLNTISNKFLANIVSFNEPELSLYLIASEIYYLFNVNAPLNYYLYNDEGNKAILSLNNQKERDTYTTAEEVIANLVNEVKRGIITLPEYLKNYISILQNKEIKTEEDIITLIEVGVNSLVKKYALSSKEQQKLLQKFLELIIVDYISLNTNRNGNTYAFLIDKTRNKISLTPNYIRNNNYKNKKYNLNGIEIDFNKLLKVIFKYYYDYVKALIRSIIDNRNVYEKCINLIADANSNLEYHEIIKEQISNRLDDLLLLDNEVDKSNISKIDLVLTKTNVNLKIVNKTSEIMSKYQNYELENTLEKDESKIVINYKEEEQEKTHLLFWILGIIGLIAVIGLVVYLILKMW